MDRGGQRQFNYDLRAPSSCDSKYQLSLNGDRYVNKEEKQRLEISDHQQSWGYEEGPWKGPGPPLLVAADF